MGKGSERLSKLVSNFVCVGFVVLLGGCPAPTPQERIGQLGGVVTPRGGGVIDLDLSGTNVTDQDMSYVHGLCSNDAQLNSIHTLDLSGTAITDESIKFMMMQRQFPSGGMQVLVLTDTAVSDAVIEEFAASAPKVRVIR
ncbi:MAG: hypothetical protein AAF497_15885 [Planctomycetota bacterium]